MFPYKSDLAGFVCMSVDIGFETSARHQFILSKKLFLLIYLQAFTLQYLNKCQFCTQFYSRLFEYVSVLLAKKEFFFFKGCKSLCCLFVWVRAIIRVL